MLKNLQDPTVNEEMITTISDDHNVSHKCSQELLEAKEDQLVEVRPVAALTHGEFKKLVDDLCTNFKLKLQKPLLPLIQFEH